MKSVGGSFSRPLKRMGFPADLWGNAIALNWGWLLASLKLYNFIQGTSTHHKD
jgi:hypothetical protein